MRTQIIVRFTIIVPAKTPPEVIAEIISLRFEGYSVEEIADTMTVNKRTAHRVLSIFKTKCEEVGIVNAAKTYKINVKDLYKLSEEKKASSLSFDQLNEGVAVAKAAKQLGYNLKNIEDTMTSIIKSILQEDHEPAKLAPYAYRLVEASDQLGTSYQEAVEKHEKLVQDIELHRIEEKQAKEKKKKAQEELTNKLKETDTTLETLGEFLETKNGLGKYGMDIYETHPLAVLLDNVAAYADNPIELVNHYKITTDAQVHTDELLKNKSELETEIAQLTSRTNELAKQIMEQELYVKAAQTLANADITPEAAATLADTVRQIAVSNNYSHDKALEKLQNDLTKYYGPLLGFEARSNFLSAREEAAKIALKDIESVRSRLETDHQGDLDAIKSLRVLNQKGVGNDDLITINLILDDNNLDAFKLRREINKLKNLPEAIESLRDEVNTLTRERNRLQEEVNNLGEKQRQLTLTTQKTEEQVANNLKRLAGELQSLVTRIEREVLNPETGLKYQTVELVTTTISEINVEMGQNRKKLLADIDKLSKAVTSSEIKVNAMLQNSYEAGKVMGALVDLDSVTRLIQGKKLSGLEEVIAIAALTAAMMDYLNRYRFYKSADSLNSFLKTYSDETNARK